jgi:hypothetical protein
LLPLPVQRMRWVILTTGFHHLNYSMQNYILADVLLLGTLHAGADCGRFPVKPKDGPGGKMPTENHCCRT